MSRFLALQVLAAIVAIAIALAGPARAAALIGETYRFTQEPGQTVAPDQLKSQYRRPERIPFPPNDPYTPEKAMLGRMLYFDPRLSDSGTMSCATCHNPGFGHGDGLAKSVGRDMRVLDRRSPTVINSAWGHSFLWDGGANSLEEQALEPIHAPSEMNLPAGAMIGALRGIAGYQPLFASAFPRRGLTPETVAEAIATYERTIVSSSAPFDAWLDGDEAAISAAAQRGFLLFNTKAGCASCHAGWLFTDEGFHDIGLPGSLRGGLPDTDDGRGALLPHIGKMRHAFKTPGLREVAVRGPYMHDGSLPTLEAVVAHYDRGGEDRPSKSRSIVPLGLSAGDQADLVAFLRTLTSPVASNVIPALPR